MSTYDHKSTETLMATLMSRHLLGSNRCTDIDDFTAKADELGLHIPDVSAMSDLQFCTSGTFEVFKDIKLPLAKSSLYTALDSYDPTQPLVVKDAVLKGMVALIMVRYTDDVEQMSSYSAALIQAHLRRVDTRGEFPYKRVLEVVHTASQGYWVVTPLDAVVAVA